LPAVQVQAKSPLPPGEDRPEKSPLPPGEG
jgi:hypothetical protein